MKWQGTTLEKNCTIAKTSIMKMRLPALLPAIILFVAVSCSKEKSIDTGSGGNGGSQANLQGTWKFVSLIGTLNETAAYNLGSDDIKIETFFTLSSKNPVGVYKITATNFNGEGIGYDFTGITNIKSYQNGVLQSDNTIPFNENVPATNTSSKYKLIGTDSIYFETGAPGDPNGDAGGCRYKLEGKKLSLFQKSDTTIVSDQGGIMIRETQKLNFTLLLEKQ